MVGFYRRKGGDGNSVRLFWCSLCGLKHVDFLIARQTRGDETSALGGIDYGDNV